MPTSYHLQHPRGAVPVRMITRRVASSVGGRITNFSTFYTSSRQTIKYYLQRAEPHRQPSTENVTGRHRPNCSLSTFNFGPMTILIDLSTISSVVSPRLPFPLGQFVGRVPSCCLTRTAHQPESLTPTRGMVTYEPEIALITLSPIARAASHSVRLNASISTAATHQRTQVPNICAVRTAGQTP